MAQKSSSSITAMQRASMLAYRNFGGGGHALRPAVKGGRIKVTDQM